MADQPYQDDDEKTASYFDDITSPLTKAGIDPDEALMNRDAAMAKLTGKPDYPGGADYPSRPAETAAAQPAQPSNPGAASTVAPVSQQPSWDDYTRQGLQGQLDATRGAQKTVAEMTKMPADDPAIGGLTAKRATDATPINPQDDKYKPTLGQRIWRGVKAGLTGGIPGAAMADYQAPNRQFGIDKQQQAQTVASDDQQITQARKNFEDATARLKNIAAEQGKVATGYKDVTTGATTAQGNENKQELQQAQEEAQRAKAELDRTRAGKEDEPKTETEIALALSKAQQSGDKVAIRKYQGALSILKTVKASGRDTSAADIAKAIQASEFGERQTDKITTEKEAERNKRYAELEKDPLIKYNASKKADKRAAIDAQLETKYAPRMQDVHDQVADMLGLTRSGQTLNQKATQRAATKTSKNAPAVGSTISVDGKPYKVTGFNQKTNKPIVTPAQ